MKDLEILEKNIGYTFNNKLLLTTAIVHKSFANENNIESYEKLEFLGDSILEFISSKYLYEKFPKLNEGELTKLRATLVCEDSLYEIAKSINMSDFILLGKSELATGGNKKVAIMADTIEALIAAMYFDSGNLDICEKFIIKHLEKEAEEASKHVGQKDHKTILQEFLQKHGNVDIEYEIIKEEGPDHDKKFTSEVKCNGKVLGVGEGKTKKDAEQEAAANYLKSIGELKED